MSKESDSLTRKHRIGYAMGDFGGCMTFGLMTAFMTRYYVNVALIDTAVIAVMTLIWKIFDAVSNPVVGVLLDKAFARSDGKHGKFRPWILRISPLLAVSAILVFTAPGWVTGASRLVVAFVTYLCYELIYAVHSICQGGLLPAMAKNETERAELSSARGIGGVLGGIVPLAVFPVILSQFGDDQQMGYAVGVTICAIIGFFLCLGYYFFTEERNLSYQSQQAAPIRVTDILEVLQKNRAIVALCLHGLLQGVLMSVSGSLGTYMYSDVLGSLSLMSVGSLLGMLVSLVLMSECPMLSRKFGMRMVLLGSLLLGAGLYVVLFALHMIFDVHVWVHIIINGLAFGIASLSNMMQWGMLSEAIEYNEYLTGKRTEGSINGTFNMLRRLGQGLGASFCVAMLGVIGYNTGAVVQSYGTITGIKALCLLLPAVSTLGSWFAFRFIWDITPEVRKKMAHSKAMQK
ncbi:MAG: MFS transporter [Oscillospiraceae bacterium]|nr:MFS transporter [Oscillospiraceae bacterium]